MLSDLSFADSNNIVLSKLNKLKQTGHCNGSFAFGFDTTKFLCSEYIEELISFADMSDEYGSDLREILIWIKVAISKSRYIFKVIDMLPNENFPKGLDVLDRMLDKAISDNTISLRGDSARQIISIVDMENIEGLELIFRGISKLESLCCVFNIEIYLWLEHHLQRLKVLFLVIRQMAEIYLVCRFLRDAKLQYSIATLRAKCRDLRGAIRANRIILEEFNISNLSVFLEDVENLISNL